MCVGGVGRVEAGTFYGIENMGDTSTHSPALSNLNVPRPASFFQPLLFLQRTFVCVLRENSRPCGVYWRKRH